MKSARLLAEVGRRGLACELAREDEGVEEGTKRAEPVSSITVVLRDCRWRMIYVKTYRDDNGVRRRKLNGDVGGLIQEVDRSESSMSE